MSNQIFNIDNLYYLNIISISNEDILVSPMKEGRFDLSDNEYKKHKKILLGIYFDKVTKESKIVVKRFIANY